jgi:hypothetical protein
MLKTAGSPGFRMVVSDDNLITFQINKPTKRSRNKSQMMPPEAVFGKRRGSSASRHGGLRLTSVRKDARVFYVDLHSSSSFSPYLSNFFKYLAKAAPSSFTGARSATTCLVDPACPRPVRLIG